MRSVKRDPAPSRIGFRVKRLWRSAAFRRLATLWAPLLIAVSALGWAAMQEEWRSLARAKVETWRAAISERPEFAVKRIEVLGATPEVEGYVRAVLFGLVGAPSLEIDAASIRDAVEEIGWVARAKVRLAAPDTLMVSVEERTPRAIWRRGGGLFLIDEEGAVVAPLAARAERPDLPVLAGAGADAAVREARLILAEAKALPIPVRGLVRIGARRWDMIFEDGPKVMLPAAGAVDAVAYLDVIERQEGVIGKDVAVIDLRLTGRPTLRLSPDAKDALEAARAPKKPGEDA